MLKIQQIVKPFNTGFSAVSVKFILNDLSDRYWNHVRDGIIFKAAKERNNYYIYCQIPDESNEKYPSDPLHTDVILRLSPPNGSAISNPSVRDYDVKVFSNCPAFMFTFTYVYNKRNGLIDMPSGFYSRKALTIKPKTRNPLMLLGIEKTLWFAICYMDENRLFTRSNLEANISDNIGVRDIIKEFKIKTQEDKLDEIERRSHKYVELRKQERKLKDKYTKQEREELDRNLRAELKVQGKTSPKKDDINKLKADMSADLSSGLNKVKSGKTLNSNLRSSLNAKRK